MHERSAASWEAMARSAADTAARALVIRTPRRLDGAPTDRWWLVSAGFARNTPECLQIAEPTQIAHARRWMS
jgi:hypothetical protein